MGRELKHTEIGDIPVDWELQTFDETFRVISHNTLSRENLNNRCGAVRNIHYGDILTKFTEILDCSEDDIPFVNDLSLLSSSTQLLQDGDVVIADTAEDETVGKVTEVQNLGNGKLVAGLHTIPCRVKKGNFAPGWLGYYMNSFLFHGQILPFITGIKVSSISKSAISEALILVPPIEEQEKIIQSLNEIHLLITAEIKIVNKIKFVKDGCLSKMFPKKGENAPKMRLPGFTGDWEQRKLGELGEIMTGSTPSTSKSGYYAEDGIPWVTPTDINSLLISKTPKRLSEEGMKVARLVPANTILCTCIASIGKNALLTVKGSFNQQINSLTPNDKNDAYFLLTESELWSDKMKRMAALGTMQIVNKTDFSELTTMVPMIDEQKKIGEYFSNLDRLITLHQRKCDKYASIKKGMMNNLLTGKIRLV